MNRNTEIEKKLNALRIEYRVVSGNYMISCPFHSDENPSFGIRSDGVWNCFSCNKHGNWKKLSNILGFEAKDLTFQELVLDRLSEAKTSEKTILSTELPYDFVKYGDRIPANVLERVSLDIIERYNIGEAKTTFPRYFIIPIIVDGYESYTCRHRTRKPSRGEERWRFAAGFTKVLFPIPQNEVIITEGILDAFAIENFGFIASACFGHSISNLQVSQLLTANVEKIVLLFDSYEKHYSNSIKKAFMVLQSIFSVSVMRLDSDADEVSEEEFVEAYEKRIYLSDVLDQMAVTNFKNQIMDRLDGY